MPRKISFWKLSALLLFLFILFRILPYLPVQPFCLFKKITGLPCPGCGSTRAVGYLLQGEWGHSWHSNPLVIPLFLYLAVVYLLSLYDQIKGTALSWKATHFPIGKWGYTILILLMLSLWVRNIVCGI